MRGSGLISVENGAEVIGNGCLNKFFAKSDVTFLRAVKGEGLAEEREEK